MEAAKDHQQRVRIAMIDAGLLDDEQFNFLASDLEARRPVVPLILVSLTIICGVAVLA